MTRIRVPPAHDLPMIVGINLDDTVRRYRRYLLQGAGPFSYDSARAAAPFALDHSLNLDMLLRQCELTRPPNGRKPNAQIIRSLWRLGGEKQWASYDPPRWQLDFRSDLAVPIRADRLIVEDEKPYLFWMQMRMGITAPTTAQLALLGRLFMLQAARAGYSDVGLLIADMRNVDGDERVLRLIPIAELVIASEAEAESKLQLFADAHDQLMREGFDPKAERMARRRRPDGEGPQPSFL